MGQSWVNPGPPHPPHPWQGYPASRDSSLGRLPATRPSEAPASFPVSFLTGLSLLGILFWLERGDGGVCMSGSFLLSRSSSLPPSSLSRCFLCQPGSTPASLLLVRAAAILPRLGLLWAVAFQSAPLMPSAPKEGSAGHVLQGGGTLTPPSFTV